MKLPIGLSDFRELRQGEYYFVDKSPLIPEIINAGAKTVLIPRPRRFGKTLNLSMVRYFLEYCEGEEREEREKLFHGLAIKGMDELNDHFGRYPVIFLTLKDLKGNKFEDFFVKITWLIIEEFERHCLKVEEVISNRQEQKVFERIREGEADENLYEGSLRLLSSLLSRAYGVNPVILIDEYDTPVHSAYVNGYYKETIAFMRGLLSGAFKDNPSLFKAVITGILRVAKESIFSGLNNLGVYTILDEKFSDCFGFTTEEVKEILSVYDLDNRFTEVNRWYNGYDFGGTVIFNPWSIINFTDRRVTKHYWANTSSNDLVRELIREGSDRLREDMEKLLRNEAFESEIDENIAFQNLKNSEKNVYSLLFFSGYLKCVEQRIEEDTLICKLMIPNGEVRYVYRDIISAWVEESFESRKLKAMLKGLTEGNIDLFSRLLNEFVITTLSFFDTKGKNPEAVYQAFILGALLNLSKDYNVSSNRELGYGRYDVLVLPKEKERLAVVMELKSITGFYEEAPEKAIEDALLQIESRGYTKELKAKGYEKILKLAVVSDGKKVWVVEGE